MTPRNGVQDGDYKAGDYASDDTTLSFNPKPNLKHRELLTRSPSCAVQLGGPF